MSGGVVGCIALALLDTAIGICAQMTCTTPVHHSFCMCVYISAITQPVIVPRPFMPGTTIPPTRAFGFTATTRLRSACGCWLPTWTSLRRGPWTPRCTRSRSSRCACLAHCHAVLTRAVCACMLCMQCALRLTLLHMPLAMCPHHATERVDLRMLPYTNGCSCHAPGALRSPAP